MGEKQSNWKNIFSVVIVFILCLWFFDYCVGCNSDDEQLNETATEQVEETEQKEIEQKKETEAERQAREQEEEKNKKEEKIKKVLEEARLMGDICPVSMYSYARDDCKNSFINTFGTPSSDEDFEMYKIYEEEYMRVWSEKQEAKRKMNNF